MEERLDDAIHILRDQVEVMPSVTVWTHRAVGLLCRATLSLGSWALLSGYTLIGRGSLFVDGLSGGIWCHRVIEAYVMMVLGM